MTEELPTDPETGKPLERRKHDLLLEKKMHKRLDDIEKKMTRAFMIGAAFLLVGMLVLGVILKIQGDTSDDIQDERYDGYVSSCNAQNERNRNTVREVELSNDTPDAKAFRIKLINNLQPFLGDCKVYAKERVKK